MRRQVTPQRARVAPEEVVDLEVEFVCQGPGALLTTLEIQIQGGRKLKLPVKAEGVLPRVEVEQDEFCFGPVYLGAFARLPLTLTNTTPVPAKLEVDLVGGRVAAAATAAVMVGVEVEERCR